MTAIAPDVTTLTEEMTDADAKDLAKLPPLSASSPIENGRRGLAATLKDVMAVINEH